MPKYTQGMRNWGVEQAGTVDRPGEWRTRAVIFFGLAAGLVGTVVGVDYLSQPGVDPVAEAGKVRKGAQILECGIVGASGPGPVCDDWQKTLDAENKTLGRAVEATRMLQRELEWYSKNGARADAETLASHLQEYARAAKALGLPLVQDWHEINPPKK